MLTPKEAKSKDGATLHYSVGALIKVGGRYLLIERAMPPFGFAGIVGHINQGETEIEALKREVKKVSGLKVERCRLVFEEDIIWSKCASGFLGHHWLLFECLVSGEIKQNYKESKLIGWYKKEDIEKLKLEPTWEYWFRKLGIIDNPK